MSNFKTKVREDGKARICSDTFRLLKSLEIRLSVLEDGQHDGRLWKENFVDEMHNKLVGEILADLAPRIKEFVVKTNPYGIHREGLGCNDDDYRVKRGESPLFMKYIEAQVINVTDDFAGVKILLSGSNCVYELYKHRWNYDYLVSLLNRSISSGEPLWIGLRCEGSEVIEDVSTQMPAYLSN